MEYKYHKIPKSEIINKVPETDAIFENVNDSLESSNSALRKVTNGNGANMNGGISVGIKETNHANGCTLTGDGSIYCNGY